MLGCWVSGQVVIFGYTKYENICFIFYIVRI